MVEQVEFRLPRMSRGCHLITEHVLRALPAPLPRTGLLNLFVKHTSCGLTINENYDPDVRGDYDGRLNLGTWQGIYLCEYRDRASARTLVATICS